MSASSSAEYQNYLNTNQSPYVMNEQQFINQKEKEQNKTVCERVEDTFFDAIESLLPQQHKIFVEYLRFAYIVNKCRINFHLSDPRKTSAITAIAIGVFFCPMPTVSFLDRCFVLAFIKPINFKHNL